MVRAASAALSFVLPVRRGVVTAALLCSAAPGALAANWVADGGNWSGYWDNPAHWSTGTVPGSATPVVIGPTSALIQIDTPSDALSVQLLGGSQIIFYSGGNLVVGQDFYADGNNVRVTVQNSGTYLNIGGELTLGSVTSFVVENEAELITRGAVIGELAGQQAGVGLFDGAHWENFASSLVVGQGGRGYITVASGSSLETGSLTIGNGDAESDVRLSGAGSSIEVTDTTIVGGTGEGELTIQGGNFSTGFLTVGDAAGSSGSVAVRDSFNADGSLVSYGAIRIGAAGFGELIIESGGGVGTLSEMIVGESTTGDGAISISGADSRLGVLGFVEIGDEGTGLLTVSDGGLFGASHYVTLGHEESGDGTVIVTGARWEQDGLGVLIVGGKGRGRFTLDDSTAQVNAFTLGDYESGDGGVTLTNGSTMNIATSGLTLGYEGRGSVRVEGGSILTIGGGLRLATAHETGWGELIVSGPYSRVSVTDDVTLIGNSGEGRVQVEAGARLETGDFRAGSTATGSGILSVTDDNSVWQATGNAWFGGEGDAELVLVDGGVALVSGDLEFGNVGGGGRGTVSVSNAGALIGGNLTQHANSTYNYIIGDGPAAGGALLVGGTATIVAGAQLSIGFDGAVQDGDTFLVLDTEGGVTGAYTLINGGQITAFLSVDAVYDPLSVSLVVSAAAFASVAQTFNQAATADGLESLGDGDPLHDVIVNIATEAEARFAFDQLSGEAHASLKSALIEDIRFVRDAANARLRAAPDGGAGIWGQAFGAWGDRDSDGNAAHLSHDTAGALIGVDTRAGGWRIGLLAGYSRLDLDVKDRASSGTSDAYHLGVYAGSAWGRIGVRSGIAYSWRQVEMERAVAFPGFAETIVSDYDAGTLQAFGEIGYRADLAPQTSLEPFLNLAHVSHRSDGFAETGGLAALSAAAQTTDVTFTTLGFRLSHGFTIGGSAASAWGMAGWRHAFGDTTPMAAHAFAGGDTFTVAGVPLDEDAALIEMGLGVPLSSRAYLGFAYSGQFGFGATDQIIKTHFNLEF
ncbi:MAG: autotransporter domain-containing protein [Micropepsaceae bacterium]